MEDLWLFCPCEFDKPLSSSFTLHTAPIKPTMLTTMPPTLVSNSDRCYSQILSTTKKAEPVFTHDWLTKGLSAGYSSPYAYNSPGKFQR